MALITGSLAERWMMPERTDQKHRADRKRLVEIGALEGGPHDGMPLLGNFITFSHGGYANPVINRGQAHSRHKSISVKTGYTHVGEGKGEMWLEMTNEINGSVADFISHPGQFNIDTGGSPFSYRPDSMAQYLDDTIKVIEVKRHPDEIDAELAEKFAAVKEFLRRVGWEFEVIFTPDIMGSLTRQHNIMRLYGRRAKTLTDDQVGKAHSIRRSGAALTLGELAGRVSPQNDIDGIVIAQALIARGHFTIDLDAPLTASSILHPVPEHHGRSLIRLTGNVQ